MTNNLERELPCYGKGLRPLWPLDPEVTYLNHGGYGVPPREVMAAQGVWRDRVEANPTRFMTREYPTAIRRAAADLASYLHASADDLVFVDTTTTGINAVLRSLELAPGDEILITSLAYGAVSNAARYVADRTGAVVVEVAIPLPLTDTGVILSAVAACLSPRTRIAIFEHIASRSALLLPVQALVAQARAAGALVLIDGAHAPGQIPVDLPSYGADFYVGNAHKWLLAPRSCAFLWAHRAVQERIHPLAISHGYGKGFTAEFDWIGARDPSAFLCVSAAIAVHERLGGTALMQRNAELAGEAARFLVKTWNTHLGGPPAAFAAMATVRLPGTLPATDQQATQLRICLADEHRIEAVIVAYAGALWLRLAAQAYNELADYQRLAAFPFQ